MAILGIFMFIGGFFFFFTMCCFIASMFSIFQGIILILFSTKIQQGYILPIQQSKTISQPQPIYISNPQSFDIKPINNSKLLPLPEKKHQIYIRPF